MPVILTATIRTSPEQRDEALAKLQGLVGDVHAENGCDFYAVHSSGKDAIVIVEQWADRETLQAHGEGAALAAITEAMKPYEVADMVVTSLRPAPAGDPAKGVIRP